jgi:hypothetical protein
VTCPVKQLASKKNWFNPSLSMQKEAAYGLLFFMPDENTQAVRVFRRHESFVSP